MRIVFFLEREYMVKPCQSEVGRLAGKIKKDSTKYEKSVHSLL
jgi:hypothetical protein